MKHRDYVAISKIIAEIDIAEGMLSGVELQDFTEDEKTKRAICMTVINIGELVKAISDEVRLKYKDIQWKEAAGFRDIAAHKYQSLDMSDVYITVMQDFPVFKKQLEQILNNETDER